MANEENITITEISPDGTETTIEITTSTTDESALSGDGDSLVEEVVEALFDVELNNEETPEDLSGNDNGDETVADFSDPEGVDSDSIIIESPDGEILSSDSLYVTDYGDESNIAAAQEEYENQLYEEDMQKEADEHYEMIEEEYEQADFDHEVADQEAYEADHDYDVSDSYDDMDSGFDSGMDFSE